MCRKSHGTDTVLCKIGRELRTVHWWCLVSMSGSVVSMVQSLTLEGS